MLTPGEVLAIKLGGLVVMVLFLGLMLRWEIKRWGSWEDDS